MNDISITIISFKSKANADDFDLYLRDKLKFRTYFYNGERSSDGEYYFIFDDEVSAMKVKKLLVDAVEEGVIELDLEDKEFRKIMDELG